MERIMLRVNEAAEALGFARTTIYKLIRENELPACRVGGSIRLSVESLREWARTKGLAFNSGAPAHRRTARSVSPRMVGS
jgi:excisionase family DNA binding protein